MKKLFKKIIRDIFYISSIFLIVLCVFEFCFPKFASPYIDLNILLLISVISGTIMIFRMS
ncbi:MAG: hypothetical protein V1891_02410 [bacterium]